MSSAARVRRRGPWSAAVRGRGRASRARGSTSSFTSFVPGRRLNVTRPNTSVALMRAAPASYTPRWGQWITWRNVRRAKGGQDTFTSCAGA